jgi:hypothetical protein
MVKYEQVFLKTWSRANRPPTLTYDVRLESLWSSQFHLECLEFGSNYFDLLQCENLLLNELLDHCVVYWPFQALFCSDDNLFKLGSLDFNFSEQLACLFLDWLKSLGGFHHFTLQRVYLLLGGALFCKPLHSFEWGQGLQLHL